MNFSGNDNGPKNGSLKFGDVLHSGRTLAFDFTKIKAKGF